MKKRLLCAVLCLLMVLSLAAPALAAKEMFQIPSVSLRITAPKVGANPSFNPTIETKNVFVVTNAPFPFVNGVNWHQYNPDNDLVESNEFQAGLRYKVTIRVRANSGSGGSFIKDANGVPNITGKINGITAAAAPVPGTTDVDLTLQFSALPKILTTASVTGIDAPVAGQTLDYTASLGSSDYKLLNKNDTTFKNGITWYDTTDSKYVSTSHKALAGHSYMVEVHLVPTAGSFSDDATGSVNGKDIGVVAGGGDEVALIYEFPVCKENTAVGGPVITLQPQNPTWPRYGNAVYKVKATGSDLAATWYLEYNGTTYNVSDITNGWEPWEEYAGENYGASGSGNTFTCRFSGIEEGLSGARLYCVISNSAGQVTSAKALITVSGTADPPTIEVPAYVSGKQGEKLTVTCKATGKGLKYVWYETSSGNLQDIIAVDRGTKTSASFNPDTSAVGTRYYVCGVTTSEGGSAYSSVIPVRISKGTNTVAAPEIKTVKLKNAVVGQQYSEKLECSDPQAQFSIWYNPGKSNDFEKTGLTLSKTGQISGKPTKAGSFTFCVCAANAGGEDYRELTLVVKEAEQESAEEVTQEVTEATQEVTKEATQEVTTGQEQQVETEGGAKLTVDWGKLALVILIPLLGVGLVAVVAIVLIVVIVKKKK